MDLKQGSTHFDDSWIRLDEIDDADFFIRFLDATRADFLKFARANPKAAFASLDLQPGMSILDCGCGTGDVLSIIAGMVAPGKALGTDFSQRMIDEATARAASLDQDNLEFQCMDVQSLALEDQSFDRVVATQLLIHVPDPRKALQEMCRVLKPGGKIVVQDVDWESMVIACDNHALGRRFSQLFADGIRNGRVVRETPGWLKAEGMVDVQVSPMPMVSLVDDDNMREWMLYPALSSFVSKGSFTEAEAAELLADLDRRRDEGRSFSVFPFYPVMATRPG
ncbi:MAG: methyltransferase domain-containing protein [Gammaproteobacteria bacterium]|nr:methyltransferase domain-containing protein [Gammaproteobacteria bacterium]